MLLLFFTNLKLFNYRFYHATPSKAAENTAEAAVGLASTHCILSRYVSKIEQGAIDEYHNPR